MNDLIAATILVALCSALLAAAPGMSAALVRVRAQRLPTRLALRMEEEWLGELNSIASRPGKLAFAIALTLTQRRAFVAPGEDSMSEVQIGRQGRSGMFGSRKALLILPAAVFSIAAYGASFLLPVRYASEARLLVVPQKATADLVRGIAEEPIENRADLLLSQVESPSVLAWILDKLPSYGIGQETRPLDGAIEKLRENIAVTFTPLRGGADSGGTLRLRYVGSDPAIAQNVTLLLTERLLELNRQSELYVAQDVLRSRLDILARRLSEKGNQLARERTAHGTAAGGMLALDYELLVSTYKSVFAEYEDAQILTAMEEASGLEMLMVQDRAHMGKPVVPNRTTMAGFGAFAGLALGGIAAVSLGRREQRRNSAAISSGK